MPLAVQEMVDCSSYTGPYGMGWVASVHHGLDRASDYPLANHSDPTLKCVLPLPLPLPLQLPPVTVACGPQS